jgi:nucleoside-diphosphate-sugar epimerase
MKIFVTGATGFIGSNFTNKALQEGNEVLALRRSDSSRTRVPLISEPIWLTKQLNEVSVQDLSGVDVVVHFAAHSMQPPYDTVENCNYWNVTAPLQLFNKAISAGVERFIVAGSCFEYGSSGERYQFIPANAPLLPTVTYAISKAEASRKFIQLAKDENLKLSIQRIFHVY